MGDLFDKFRPWGWLPDETLFSYGCRYHLLSGDADPSSTALRLFGARSAGALHDFPCGLDAFAAGLPLLGSADSILRERTIAPFFFPFVSKEKTDLVICTMRSASARDLKSRLGLLRMGFGADHPLKYCVDCVQADRRSVLVSYWHRAHQIPGVWVCHIHGSTLKCLAPARLHGRLYTWVLPSGEAAPLDETRLSAGARELADFALGVVALPSAFRFERARLVLTIKRRLENLGLLTAKGIARVAALAPRFQDTYSGLRDVPEFNKAPPDHDACKRRLSRMTLPRFDVHHPTQP